MVCAQTPGEVQPADVRRPFRGLFGAPPSPGGRQSLDATFSVFGAYDQDVFAEQGAVTVPEVRQGGAYEGFDGGLSYARRGRRVRFNLDGSAGATNYPNQPLFVMYRAGTAISADLTRNTDLSISESFVYAPEFRLGLFVNPIAGSGFIDPFVGVAGDLGIYRDRSYRSNTYVGMSHQFRNRGRVSGFYSLLTATYATEQANYVNQGVGARYERGITRNIGMHAGYSYGIGRYPNAATNSRRGVHNLDIGLDYARALSISRRTRFSFSTGSAFYYATQELAAGAPQRLNYTLLGNAQLSHEMGRTWTTSVAYQRSLDFHEGFIDPFLAQSVSANLSGLLARRLQFNSTAGYTRGVIGARTNNEYDSGSASVGLQYGLTRNLAAYANYVFYRYSFPEGVAIDDRFPPSLSRNGVRVGVTASLPIIRTK
jgi:hypothetical protein